MITLEYARIGHYDFTSQIFADELNAWQRKQLKLAQVDSSTGSDESVTVYGEFRVDWYGNEPTIRIEYIQAVKGRHALDLTAEDINIEHLTEYIAKRGSFMRDDAG